MSKLCEIVELTIAGGVRATGETGTDPPLSLDPPNS